MPQGYRVVDPGHRYALLALDGDYEQELQFVKRHDPENPTRFPRNTSSYSGTTLQCVLRALAQRIRYLQGQKPCTENTVILNLISQILWLLEKRAARRHGKEYDHSPEFALTAPVCSICGHTVCDHANDS